VVESGNGRTLALRRAYREGRAEPYRQFLERQGFDTAGMQAPVLVARRVTPLTGDGRAALALEANQSSTLTIGAAEVARGDAKRLDRLLPSLQPGEVSLVRNRAFVRGFLEILPEGERGAMLTAEGELSQAGRRRIEAALLARAYGDAAPELVARVSESTESDVKAVAELFGGGLTDTGRAWLGSFFRDPNLSRPVSRQALADRIGQYIEEAMKSTPGRDMFGAPELAGLDLLRGEARLALGDAARSDHTLLQQAVPHAEDAAVLDAQRITAADVPVPVLDAEGNVVSVEMRKASDLMAADDEAERAARESASCLIGAVTEGAT
jgi:hypothetical protein